jgi:predicted NAD/FAD-binding protein
LKASNVRERVAIIGSGISGLGCLRFLSSTYEISLFDSDSRPGGHAHTIDVKDPLTGKGQPMDTGFMVFNEVTYPHLCRLFKELNIEWKKTNMSFSVRNDLLGIEWCGSSINHLFAQRKNLLNFRFWKLLWQINKFNKLAQQAWQTAEAEKTSLKAWCKKNKLGEDFLQCYLIPMSSAVWSTPPEKMLSFPAATLMRFFYNHGFLGLNTQHQWLTPVNGSRIYVEALLKKYPFKKHLGEGVLAVKRSHGKIVITTTQGEHEFDRVIFATHADQSLKLLQDADELERSVLSPFKYNQNLACVHTDSSPMPKTRLAWSAWNYQNWIFNNQRCNSTHYWMNALQGLTPNENFFVTINYPEQINSAKVIKKIPTEHPLFSLEAVAAQNQIQALNQRPESKIHFVGAWQRYGFHEDGLWSAHRLCSYLLGRDAWTI